jgi:crotonobetainyl-CoA:carnitine CoA-transferase CaiB-like acyl-CoA transferase
MPTVLRGIRVLDRTVGIAGPYCSKVLADAGADVVKVEPEGGDLLRAWGSGALFEFLNTSKRSVLEADGLDERADVLLVDVAVDTNELWRANPKLIIVTITPFGLDGPWCGRPATEFTLQAAAGSTGHRGLPDREPLAVGGRLGEWITGTYAALAATAALFDVRRGGRGQHIDVAMLDCMATTMALMPSVYASFYGWPPQQGTGRTIEVPSVEPTKDGFVVFTTNSAQQYSDFCIMIEHPELLEEKKLARPHVRFERRDEFEAAVHDYTTKRTTQEVLEQAALFRIPSGPVLNGSSIPEFPHFVERKVFVPSPSGRFSQPRVPFRISGVDARPFEPAPALGEHTSSVEWQPRRREASDRARRLPLDGIRVVDCTAWWAGPAASEALACLGADVIKVESITRPDFMRYAATQPPTVDEWWEWSPLFHAANAGKRGITLDLNRAEGIAAFERLVRSADVFVENYTPRVMEQFGLGWDRVHELNTELIMVRMPAFGLDGPWRDHTGFAQTMECVSGMAWLTGFADGPPVLVRGACDPLAGMHAVIATLLALHERETNGGGRLVESVMVEAALNAAAEQVVEHGASGTLLSRDGNRGPEAAPQGVYPCAGTDSWIAIAVADDDQWRRLRDVLGAPPWTNGSHLETSAGRRAAHDDIDEHLRSWTRECDAADLEATLAAAGVPAAVVIAARDIVTNPQIRHRRLFETEHHPVTGEHDLPGLPFRFAGVAAWIPGPAPTIGQHTAEVLAEVGLLPAEIDELRRAGVIGARPVGV